MTESSGEPSLPSILELYRVGHGPSSSHTLGPVRAAQLFCESNPGERPIKVTLFGALAATGKGHLIDVALRDCLGERLAEVLWEPETFLPRHPNALRFQLVDAPDDTNARTYYSVGGGALVYDGHADEEGTPIYKEATLEAVIETCTSQGIPIWQLVENTEPDNLWDSLGDRWSVMSDAIERGLCAEGVLPGGLRLERRARSYYRRVRSGHTSLSRGALLSAFALAVAEENAAAGLIVTAPTCGAAGVLPAVLRYCRQAFDLSDIEIVRALAVAGLIGTLVKVNASISGAQVGCQGEIGTACAMAAGAAAWLMGGTLRQIEYAAEMGIEHHLGLTCDPVLGLVQIPCIERNAFGAMRAIDCAEYALLSDGNHRILFDEIVEVMLQTGTDMHHKYRETSLGGIAALPSRESCRLR